MTPQQLAEHVLTVTTDRAGGDAEIEVSVDRQELALTRFANSAIHQHVTDDTTTVQLRLHLDGRTTSTSTTVSNPAGIDAMVDRAVASVRVAPAEPGWPGLTPPPPGEASAAGEVFAAGGAGYDEATADADPRARAEQVRAFVAAVGADATAAGYCRTLGWQGAFVNSAGHAVTARTTEAALDGIARQHGRDGVARQAAVSLTDLDGAALGRRAGAKAATGQDPIELPPGEYEVVLEPCAVADVLANLAAWGFNGRTYADGQSFAQLGEAQFDPAVTIVDDPYAAGSPGRTYDREGTVRRRLTLVEQGVTRAVTHNRRSAALAGPPAVATGHTSPIPLLPGAVAGNLGLRPDPTSGAGAAAPAAVDPAAVPLIAGVGRGLLVSDLWYTRVLDPKRLVMTGLTRNGVWLIEDGEITRPVQNLRFTQSYPAALAPGAVRGVGPTAPVLPTPWGVAWWRAPGLHLAGWRFTGGAAG
ncbi:TldD/PmbA family protein [Natronosporangium hydrolyticum]|uniref:TldD/PmbA family protein n=1 Tax=Natronosporangium hydrolyticum TaxID=2811111 RepID=A0A895YCD2_9ACTN|nr:metallopeptidase TldD-related protein [Natronosporangium hydrolyticum]QSB13862.1 TldD/PmbA family protein [Natronosporangium hydrolyticum]